MVRVQEVSPAPLPRGERGCGQRPRCWQDPWGSRSRGQCAVGTHLRVLGSWVYKAQSQLCVALLGCLVIGGRMSPVSLKLPHAPCAPLSLITFKCSCRASLWPLAEPFQPKLGLSLYERLMPIFTPSKDYTQLNKPLNTALHVLSMHIQLLAISAWLTCIRFS